MPAAGSILTKQKNESSFLPVDNAKKLYREIFYLCLSLPQRYKYFISQSIHDLASDVLDNVVKANKVFINRKEKDLDEMKRRLVYWRRAKESLQALSTKVDFLIYLDVPSKDVDEQSNCENNKKYAPGISLNTLRMISDLIIKEQELLTKIIKNEYRNLYNSKN